MLERGPDAELDGLGPYKYSVQCLWVMCSRQCACVLHVTFEIPKLLETDSRNVHNVAGLTDWRLRVRSIRHCGTKGQYEAREAFVQSEKTEHLVGHLRRRRGLLGRDGLLVCRHILRVQLGDLEDVYGNASSVTTTGPLRILLDWWQSALATGMVEQGAQVYESHRTPGYRLSHKAVPSCSAVATSPCPRTGVTLLSG